MMVVLVMAAFLPAGAAAASDPPPTLVWVDAAWSEGSCGGHEWGLDAFATIQEGVDAVAPGGTVKVESGTYDEQVVIDKGLTLTGAGDQTIVAPSSPASLRTVYEGYSWAGTRKVAGIIVAADTVADPVTIRNLKVAGDGVTDRPEGSDCVAGIFARESTVTIDDVDVTGVLVGATGTAVRGYGIYLSAGGGSPVPAVVSHSRLSSYDKNGIEAAGVSLTVIVHRNAITGRGALPEGDEVQNGILVAGGASARIEDNTITDHAYSPETWWSCAILFYGGQGSAARNSISDCQSGIIFQDGSGSARANRVTGGKVGLNAQYLSAGPWDASFSDNIVSGSDIYAMGAATYNAGATLRVTMTGNRLTEGTGDGLWLGDLPENNPDGGVLGTIENNYIEGWANGIRLASSVAQGSIITGNTISANVSSGSGIHIDAAVSAANAAAERNMFMGNKEYAIFNSGAGVFQARDNWWGDASGPYHETLNQEGSGNRVSDNVDFSPWDAGQLQLTAPSRVRFGRTVPLSARLRLSDGTSITVPVDVTFTATDGSLDSPVTTVDGVATASWTAYADEGPVDITASAAGLETAARLRVYEPTPRKPALPPATTGGFTARSEDGMITVEVPENISDVPVRLTVAPSDDPPPTGGNLLVGHIVDIEMFVQATGSGVHDLTQSLTIVFHISAADLAAAGVTDPSELRLWYWDTDADPPTWVALPTAYDPAAGTLTATVDHLTTFAAMVDPEFPALPDVRGHWAEEAVLRLASVGAVSGYEDGTFRPGLPVTRAQFAKLLAVSLRLEPGQTLGSFSDARAVPVWAAPYVAACVREDILTGSNGLLRPNEDITRVEAAAMIVRALDLADGAEGDGTDGQGLTFTDAASIPTWASEAVAEAIDHGLIEGLPGNVFDPFRQLTRAEAASLLCRAMDVGS